MRTYLLKKNASFFLVLIVILFNLIACQSVRKIPKPDGEFCITDIPNEAAYCEDLKTKTPLPDRSLPQIDGWITMPVGTYNNILDYIDRIIERIGGKTVKINAEELGQVRAELYYMVEAAKERKDAAIK